MRLLLLAAIVLVSFASGQTLSTNTFEGEGGTSDSGLTLPTAVCECKDSWSIDDDPGCKDQNGCTNCDDDDNGKWCEVKDPNCSGVEVDEDGASEGWFYCESDSELTLPTICECQDKWSDDNDPGCKDQIGCTNCDDDDKGKWCAVKDQNCNGVEVDENGDSEGWFYCEPKNSDSSLTLPTSVCECKDSWSIDDDPGCQDQNGCTNCDDDDNGKWCEVKDPNCNGVEVDENGASEGWFYCETTTNTCTSSQWQCDDGECIDATYKCDSSPDCADESDEVGCTCLSWEWECDDGQCIYGTFRCDGAPDCGDESDEVDCENHITEPVSCSGDEHLCGSGICIDRDWVCDDYEDCSDGSDEKNCDSNGAITSKPTSEATEDPEPFFDLSEVVPVLTMEDGSEDGVKFTCSIPDEQNTLIHYYLQFELFVDGENEAIEDTVISNTDKFVVDDFQVEAQLMNKNFKCRISRTILNVSQYSNGIMARTSCDTYKCSHWKYRLVNKPVEKACEVWGCDDKTCCVKKKCQGYKCPFNMKLQPIPWKIKCHVTGCDNDTCCMPRDVKCKEHQCPDNLQHIGQAWKKVCAASGCTNELCCTPKTCENYVCQNPLKQLRRDHKNIKCPRHGCKEWKCCKGKKHKQVVCDTFTCDESAGLKLIHEARWVTCKNKICDADRCCVDATTNYSKYEWNRKNRNVQECKDWTCGKPNALNRHRRNLIVHGEVAEMNEYPFMVHLELINDEGSKLMCGGTIISENVVMSAAHCTEDIKADDMTVYAGIHDLRDSEEDAGFKKFKVHSYVNHAKYDTGSHYNFDIALIKIEGSFPCNNRHIEPTCLAEAKDSKDLDGYVSWVIGWGTLGEDKNAAAVLREVPLEIMSRSTCLKNSDYGKPDKTILDVTWNMICADAEHQDSCQGDSGGPLFFDVDSKYDAHQYVQIGVVSFGQGCNRDRFPGVYTDVNRMKFFIRRHVKNGHWIDVDDKQVPKYKSSLYHTNKRPLCECKDVWSSEGPECQNQNGCTNCDNDDTGKWCIAKDTNCINLELKDDGTPDDWFYCGALEAEKSMYFYCPNGEPAFCCDLDGDCSDGDDDWCCGDGEYFCSTDSATYAESMGGKLCQETDITCPRCYQLFEELGGCYLWLTNSDISDYTDDIGEKYYECSDCEYSRTNADLVSTCGGTPPEVDCENCLATFKTNGGCDAWLENNIINKYIPEGCFVCKDEFDPDLGLNFPLTCGGRPSEVDCQACGLELEKIGGCDDIRAAYFNDDYLDPEEIIPDGCGVCDDEDMNLLPICFPELVEEENVGFGKTQKPCWMCTQIFAQGGNCDKKMTEQPSRCNCPVEDYEAYCVQWAVENDVGNIDKSLQHIQLTEYVIFATFGIMCLVIAYYVRSNGKSKTVEKYKSLLEDEI